MATLVYADIFDFPLKKQEIWERMVGSRKSEVGSRIKQKERDFVSSLKSLVKQGKIEKSGEFYFLKGRREIVGKRLRREGESLRKLKRAKKIAAILKIIPTVKFVGVSGGLAAMNADKNDDIDFFIITSANWLWTTRFLVTFLLSLLGLRRKVGGKIYRDKICLNMFLDEKYLDIFWQNRNIFTAYEIMLLKPLWQRNDVYRKFLSANLWVKNFLPNSLHTVIPSDSRGIPLAEDRLAKGIPLLAPKFRGLVGMTKQSNGYITEWLNKIEKVFYKFQIWWMKGKRTKEIITPYFIKFHPKDLKEEVLRKFENKLSFEHHQCAQRDSNPRPTA